MASSTNINQNNNVVTLQDNNGSLSITNNNTGTTVNVTQPVTNIVSVAAIGPQGPVGPIPSSGAFTGSFSGSFTGSLQGTASNAISASYALTASYLSGYVSPFPYTGSAIISGSLTVTGSVQATGGFSGSFSGSGANLFDIPASGITGLNLSQIATGSVSASVSPGTASFAIVSGSSTFMFVSSSGNVGFGTNSPTYKLSVSGSQLVTGIGVGSHDVFRVTAGNGYSYGINNDGQFILTGAYNGILIRNSAGLKGANLGSYGPAGYLDLGQNGSTYIYLDGGSGGSINSYFINNLSIGSSTNAGYKLDVNGTARVVTSIEVNSKTLGGGASALATNTAYGQNTLTAVSANGYNTAIGYIALQNNTGTINTAVGAYALTQNSSGTQNVALGGYAGSSITSGGNIVVIGYNAQLGSGGQSNEIVIGYNAVGLGSNTTVIGNSSTTFGRWWGNLLIGTSTNTGYTLNVSGSTNITGDLTVTGSATLTGALTASNATISGNVTVLGTASISTLVVNQIGYSSGSNQLGDAADDTQTLFGTVRIPTGSLIVSGALAVTSSATIQTLTVGLGNSAVSTNTALGFQVLRVNTTGEANVGVGYRTFYSNTSGGYNVAVGYQSLYNNLGGNNNVAIGWYSLFNSTNGSGNTAVGLSSLQSNTIGNSNTALGRQSLFLNISGSNITAIGHSSLRSNTANNNTALGYESAFSNTTGAQITAVGNAALRSNTLGSNNSAFGDGALYFNTIGNNNVSLGAYSLFRNVSGSNNTSIGDTSLSFTTADNNVAIGYLAGNANTSGSNNIFIGVNSTGVSAGESNRTWIGNSSTTSTWLAGNVLIGTTTDAGYLLDVNGSARSTAFRLTDNTLIASAYTVGGTTLTISNGGHYGSIGINVSSATGIRAVSTIGIDSSGVTGASIYAAGGSTGGRISLGLLSNRALITSVASGMAMHTSSMLQVDSTTQGFLPPRTNLTSNISTPAQGLMTYLTGSTNEGLYYYSSGSIKSWTRLLNDTGSQAISGSLTITGSNPLLRLNGSGSELMSVDGASGRLFTVSDDLSNSLFSVNTIAGLPVIEAFATNDVFLGKYNTYPIKTVASGTLAVITGSISGSVAAPGSTTQIVYNNGGVLGANSGLVYSSSRVGIGTSTPSYTLDTSGYGRFTSGVVVNAGQRVSLGGSDYGSDALYSAGGGPLNVRGYYYTRFTKADATLGPQVIQVEGQSLLKGSGTTSATTALLVQNANASASLSITDDRIVTIPIQLSVSQINSTVVGGDVTFNNRITFNTFAPTSGATVSFSNGSRLSFLSGGPQNAVTRLDLNTTLQNNSAGSVQSIGFVDYVTVNLTGTANDTYTSYLASPTLTSLNSGSYRAFSWNNNTGFGLYGTGTSQNVLRGNLHIGSLITSSNTLSVAGTTRISGSFNTATSGSILTVIGSGSAQPIFTVQGSQGELFSITDSLSGSLFSVNDISGLPILEVFSDNTTLIGNYQDPMLITTAKVVQTNSGSFTVYSLPTASYDTAFFEYSVKSGSNARAGTIMAIQLGSTVNFTETTTTDFGDTTAVSFTVIVTGSNMALTGSSTTGSWTIKTIVRGL